MSEPKGKKTLAGFELVKTLGKGGMGAVYKAIHPRTGAEVAIKVILQGLQGREEVQERFRREVRAMAMVEHPNLVRILEAGEEQGSSYYVMQLVDGVDLATYIQKKGPMKPGLVENIAKGLFSALGALHDAGILHRDLKPHNVMLDRGGQPLIMDLGLTRLSDMQTMTRTGALIGSPRYMPPELLEGRPLDARSDIYQVGLILWECATGETAVTGETFQEVSAKILTGQIPTILEKRPDFPAIFADVIHQCILVEPEERIQTGHQALDVLEGRIEMEELRQELTESAARRLEATFESPQAARVRASAKGIGGPTTVAMGAEDPGDGAPPSRASVVWTRVIPGLLFIACLIAGYNLAQPPEVVRPEDFVAIAGTSRIKASWTGAEGTRLQLVVKDGKGRTWRVPESGPRVIDPLPGGRSELVLEGLPAGASLEAYLEFGDKRTLGRNLETPEELFREDLRLIGLEDGSVALSVETNLECTVEVKYPRIGGSVLRAEGAAGRSHSVALKDVDLSREDASLRIRITDPTGAVEDPEPPIVSLLTEAGKALIRRTGALDVVGTCNSLRANEDDPESARRILAQSGLEQMAVEFRPLAEPFFLARDVEGETRRRAVQAIDDLRHLEVGFLAVGLKPGASPTELLQGHYLRGERDQGWTEIHRAANKAHSLLPPETPDKLMFGPELTREYPMEFPRLPRGTKRVRIGMRMRLQRGHARGYMRLALPQGPVLKDFPETPVRTDRGRVIVRELDVRDLPRKGGVISVTAHPVNALLTKPIRFYDYWVEIRKN